MDNYFKQNEWNIIEDGFNPEKNLISESIFSLGNGHMGQRANFEERYSGETLQGNYMAGVYYPDKTRVGWWKNGYPEYFAKVINSANWIGIDVNVEGKDLDLHKCNLKRFKRILNMREGYLERKFDAVMPSGKEIRVNSRRFLSMSSPEIACIRYSIMPLDFSGNICLTPYIDGDVMNSDSNYDEKFWDETYKINEKKFSSIIMKTKKLDFMVCTSMGVVLTENGRKIEVEPELFSKGKYVQNKYSIFVNKDTEIVLYKYISNVTSRDHLKDNLLSYGRKILMESLDKGFDDLFKEHADKWTDIWKNSDIVIKGDLKAQQAIRFDIFQLNQTYTGDDDRLNIGPKGFTGEKYGGSTYWDTEAYCIPFYLGTSDPKVARNLLIYRYKQLDKAIENARKLGIKKGALYPMVTMNGEECHNEWEITFEEIHRNGAIAHAIYDYVNYTGDKSYLGEYGFEVLVQIARFWKERITYSGAKKKFVLLGVTGPNEYENNVNNNWYTNKIACWSMKYAIEVNNYLKSNLPKMYEELKDKLELEDDELKKWQYVIDNMYYPYDEENKVFLQQDGYMDKEQTLVKDLNPLEIPINQHWSWDRILRSCFIKQADVLQGIFFFEDGFDFDTIKRNFDFYEPRTVHESSLSPCVHCILASKLRYKEKAYEMYLRTARLDLDNYNNDTKDGCHITSMAGTWMSIVMGFGGLRIRNGKIYLNPLMPESWGSFSFKILFRGSLIKFKFGKCDIEITKESGQELIININNKDYLIKDRENIKY